MAKGRKTGGRAAGVPNKATAEVRTVAQQYGPAALHALAKLAGIVARDDGQPDGIAISESVRVTALLSILDRAYGKPTQPLEQLGPGGRPFDERPCYVLQMVR